jgi:hypothetical protein
VAILAGVAAILTAISQGWSLIARKRLSRTRLRRVEVLPLSFRVDLDPTGSAAHVQVYILNRRWWPISVVGGEISHVQVGHQVLDDLEFRGTMVLPARSWGVLSLRRRFCHCETPPIDSGTYGTTIAGSIQFQGPFGWIRQLDIETSPPVQGHVRGSLASGSQTLKASPEQTPASEKTHGASGSAG